MEPINRKIQALVDMYLNRELLLPEMQRKYVWRATQVRDLIDSIYRDYPSGAILVWETSTIPQVKDAAFEQTDQKPMGKQLLLLDGQQRVTSLASVLTGLPVRVKEGTKVKEKNVEVFFNIDHPDDSGLPAEDDVQYEVGDIVEAKWDEDEEFYVAKIVEVDGRRYFVHFDDGDQEWSEEVRPLGQDNRKELFFRLKHRSIERKSNWIAVTKLFKGGVGSIMRDLKIGFDHPNFDKYNQRLNQLYSRKEHYLYPIQIIREKTYSEVTDIFIRVNSSGTRLRGSDLALAQITSVWPGAMKEFETFVDACIAKDFYLDENFLVRCIVCLSTKQAKFDNLSRITQKGLGDSWILAKKGIQNTINFLRNNAYTDSTALLPSNSLMIPLICYAAQHDLSASPIVERGFLYWLYNAAIWARYSTSSESKISEDLVSLIGPTPWKSLVENVWKAVGAERQVTPADIRGKGVNNPLFYMMYVLARSNGARDLETGMVVNYANFGNKNAVEFDHIFPRSKLEAHFKDGVSVADRKRMINEIANMAFLTKRGNIIKSNDDPAVYFPKAHAKQQGTAIFQAQQIPYDLTLLPYDQYERFLTTRATLLSAAVNNFVTALKP